MILANEQQEATIIAVNLKDIAVDLKEKERNKRDTIRLIETKNLLLI